MLDLPENRVRVIAPDVGGGFGAKIEFTAEDVLTAFLAMRLRRPVRWVEERRENFLNMVHGRGQIDYVDAAVTASGEIVGLKIRAIADLGGKVQLHHAGYRRVDAGRPARAVPHGQYRIRARGRLYQQDPRRRVPGAGRPEATYLVERIVDVIAAELSSIPGPSAAPTSSPPTRFRTPPRSGRPTTPATTAPPSTNCWRWPGTPGCASSRRPRALTPVDR